jgi:glycosyltransferase involved in cell wall biosynthesis
LKVSIITATFNREGTIKRAIRSIKGQLYQNIEVVIVDGASTDGTITVVKPLLSKNDSCVSEKDGGIYDALNKGIERSTGEIIGFLHSDDIFYNDSVISKVVESFKDESVDVVYGDACFFRKGNFKKTVRYYRSHELSLKNLAWGQMPAHTAMFVRKSIYQNYGGFDTSYKICGDYEFLCRLVSIVTPKSVYLPEKIVRMQIGGVSTGGFKNTVILNKEVLMSCRANGIYTNLFMILSKYPSKILQLIRR